MRPGDVVSLLIGPRDGNHACDLTAVCLLYTSDAADERSSVDLGGRRIIKKKNVSDNDVWITLTIHTDS